MKVCCRRKASAIAINFSLFENLAKSDMALVRTMEGVIPEQMVQLATIASRGLTQVIGDMCHLAMKRHVDTKNVDLSILNYQVLEQSKDFVAKEAKAVARNAFAGLMDPTILILVTLIGEQRHLRWI